MWFMHLAAVAREISERASRGSSPRTASSPLPQPLPASAFWRWPDATRVPQPAETSVCTPYCYYLAFGTNIILDLTGKDGHAEVRSSHVGLDASALDGTAQMLAANGRWEYEDLPYWGGEADCCINAFTLANGAWLGADVSSLQEWFVEHQLADGARHGKWGRSTCSLGDSSTPPRRANSSHPGRRTSHFRFGGCTARSERWTTSGMRHSPTRSRPTRGSPMPSRSFGRRETRMARGPRSGGIPVASGSTSTSTRGSLRRG